MCTSQTSSFDKKPRKTKKSSEQGKKEKKHDPVAEKTFLDEKFPGWSSGQQLVELGIAEKLNRWNATAMNIEHDRAERKALGMPLVSLIGAAPLPVRLGKKYAGWTYFTFLDYVTGEHHSVLVYGKHKTAGATNALGNGEDVLVRVHSSAKHSDIFFGAEKDRSACMSVEKSMTQIMREGRGVVVYTEMDGRGNGIAAQMNSLNNRFKFKEGKIVPVLNAEGKPVSVEESYRMGNYLPSAKDYSVVSQMLVKIGVRSARIITNSHDKLQALADGGIKVTNAASGEPVAPSKENVPAPALQIPGEEERRNARQSYLRQQDWEMLAEARFPWQFVKRNLKIIKKMSGELIEPIGYAPVKTSFGDWTMCTFGDYTTGEVHRVLVFGEYDPRKGIGPEPALMRLHSACKTNEIFCSTNCECQEELRMAMREIQKTGRGFILYMDQEGRGTGMRGKSVQLRNMFRFITEDPESIDSKFGKKGKEVETAEAYEMSGYPKETRKFSVGLEILKALRVQELKLLTNNPQKADDLKAYFKVKRKGIFADPANVRDPERVYKELRNKKIKLRHRIPKRVLQGYRDFLAANKWASRAVRLAAFLDKDKRSRRKK